MNLPLPESVASQPELEQGLEWYLDAFFELSTDRPMGFGPGPIPGRSIREFGRDCELTSDEQDDLAYLMRRMDGVWLDHAAKQMKRHQRKKGAENDG